MRTMLASALGAALIVLSPCAASATDVAVPAHCTAAVNAQLAQLIAEKHAGAVDNVMVCGTTFGASRRQRGGPHGDHQVLPLRIPLPGGGSALVEVVTNDSLDGRVTAPKGAAVSAFGQYFHTTARQRPFVAGVHDVHCATHHGADDGWVVVNGTKFPKRACATT